MIVRFARASDVEAILDLFERVADERVYIGTEPGFDRADKGRRLQQTIADGVTSALFVASAEPDGLPAGIVAVYQNDEFGPTLGMMVDAPVRGRGIGTALLERAIAWARERGRRTLSLMVFPHNERAIALYRRFGFVEIQRFEADVTRQTGEVWDTMLMRRSLEDGAAS